MRMEFSVGTGRNERVYEIASIARTAEESGFSSLTFLDSQNMSRDVYVVMAIAALNTHSIRIGQGVTMPFTRHPSVTANATATINELSGGRAFVGIGSGGSGLFTMGMKPRPLKELREVVLFVKKYAAGEEAEFQGARMHSEWIRQPLKVYIGGGGPKMLQLAGEVADGVILSSDFGINPVAMKWKLEQIEKGALRTGRDPSEIDVWARGMIYVAESKEAARREVAGYAVNSAIATAMKLQGVGWHPRAVASDPDTVDVLQRLERAYPGLLEECKRVYAAWDTSQHERADAPAAQRVTQRIIDLYHMAGTTEDICEKIAKIGELGIKTVATTLYTIVDKKGMMREIGDKVIPYFRN